MKPDDAQTLYGHYYDKVYQDFILNEENGDLSLQGKGWGFLATSFSKDVFSKNEVPLTRGKIQIVTKNQQSHAILWKTEPEKIKEAVRWGIIKAESITGQVISTLGKYRIICHERIARGMVSNTQALKLALLDIYQDRFEALQELESLVNKNCSMEEYAAALTRYKRVLGEIQSKIENTFAKMHLDKLGYQTLTGTISKDIDSDIQRASDYEHRLKNLPSLKKANRARGNHSVLEFVKQQMHNNLYALQGLNEAVISSIGALTRGDLNDCIEDARKAIDDHRADMRNAITAKHQGDFSDPRHTRITWDFSRDDLNQEQERQTMLAISFIEGWDKVDYTSNWNKPCVSNLNNETAELAKISATKWNKHRNNGRYFLEYLKNWFTSIIFPTHPWDEGVSDDMHLFADDLKKHTRPHEPLWKKGLYFVLGICAGLQDIFLGLYNFGKDFVLDLPRALEEDIYSTQTLPPLQVTLDQAGANIHKINTLEKETLNALLEEIKSPAIANIQSSTILAEADYHLTAGEEQDPLNALTHALGEFSGHFTHNLFAKDPVGALLFSTAVGVGGMCIFFPALTKSLVLDVYFKSFTSFSKLVGSTPFSEAFCAGLLQGQAAHLLWNGILEGPSSSAVSATAELLENPIPYAIGFAAAYGLGYLLANIPIPGLHELIEDELGESDILNYPVIGVKLGITSIKIIVSDKQENYRSIEIPLNSQKLTLKYEDLGPEDMQAMGLMMKQLQLIQWLNSNASQLPKLDRKIQFDISRQIALVFSQEQARSLNKLIYPEETKSIAYQFFAIPLGYVTAIMRLGFSMLVSSGAWLAENPHPAEPIKRASEALWQKIRKDLNRLNVVASNLLFTTVNLLASPFKALASIFSLLLSRIAAFFDYHPAHAVHQGFAAVHETYRDIGSFLSPDRAMKAVVSAHPVHTMNEVAHTYQELFKPFEKNAAPGLKVEASAEVENVLMEC